MKLKQISSIGLVLLLFYCSTQINVIFASPAIQYQLYRLSNDLSDDRRPKLAINDEGTVWVVWESNRDGDFDIYGKRFENSDWSDLIAFSPDTNTTFVCDALIDGKNKLVIFGTEIDLVNDPYPEYYFEKSQLFCLPFVEDSAVQKQVLAEVHHWDPYLNNHQLYPNDMPKVISFDQNIFVCYFRKSQWNYSCDDSLFLRSYEEEIWHAEYCDTIFQDYDGGILQEWHYTFPVFRINLINGGLFVIYYWYDRHGTGPLIENIGLILGKNHIPRYIKLTRYIDDYYQGRTGLQAFSYGSNLRNIFIAGFSYREKYSLEKTHFIKQIELINDTLVLDKKEWLFNFKDNIKISQMSDLVAFVWSDAANIYIKTFQDSIWYKTLELPLNDLTHIDQSLNCTVYNNQQIWVTFDAIYNGNKDVYALTVPASFVVDTVMTSVKQRAVDITSPNDFSLFQNYPNPFNSITTIKYSIPPGKSSYHVTLKIYDIRGRLVTTLVNQNQSAGMYSVNWDGSDDIGNHVSSGVYFYSLEAEGYKSNQKILLIN